MPKLTNKYGLPAPIVRAVERDPYSRGKAHFSVTELIDSPRVRDLRVLYDSDIEEDVSDFVFSLFGRAIHKMLEDGAEAGTQTEERLYLDVDGYIVSGSMDLQEDQDGGVLITDYKVTTVSSATRASKADWEEQLNSYAHLVRRVKGKKVKGLQIVALLRDWQSARSEGANYPSAPVLVREFPVWSDNAAQVFLEHRVKAHKEAHLQTMRASQDRTRGPWADPMVNCTMEEQWRSEDMYAVWKEGNKRATSVWPTAEEAGAALDALIDANKKGTFDIKIRAGEAKRCEGNWCGVAPWCAQYAKEKKSSGEGAESQ